MSQPTVIRTLEYRVERNRRMASYKGRYNCEIVINGSYAGDAQGDTEREARAAAERTVRGWERAGTVVRRG